MNREPLDGIYIPHGKGGVASTVSQINRLDELLRSAFLASYEAVASAGVNALSNSYRHRPPLGIMCPVGAVLAVTFFDIAELNMPLIRNGPPLDHETAGESSPHSKAMQMQWAYGDTGEERLTPVLQRQTLVSGASWDHFLRRINGHSGSGKVARGR